MKFELDTDITFISRIITIQDRGELFALRTIVNSVAYIKEIQDLIEKDVSSWKNYDKPELHAKMELIIKSAKNIAEQLNKLDIDVRKLK